MSGLVYPITPGSIPAWAGETQMLAAIRCSKAVYPRVGGGNRAQHSAQRLCWGLSPRGRGKLIRRLLVSLRGGSIPAWAGETQDLAFKRAVGRVYPRVGGGNAPSM